MSTRTLSPQKGPRGVSPSLVYGLTFGVWFSLVAWGYDGLVRDSHNGFWPVLSFASAAPVLLVACGVAGHVLRKSDDARAWVWLWLVVGAVAGGLVIFAPTAGHAVATWLSEPGLAGLAIRPFPKDLRDSAVLYTLLLAGVGAVVGLAGHAFVLRARAAQLATGRIPVRSWARVLVCVPIAVLTGLAGDNLVNDQSRASLVAASDSLSGRVSESFVLHSVALDAGRQREVLDVILDDGFAMRCTMSRGMISNCNTVSSSYREWMRAIVEAARSGRQTTDAMVGVTGLGVSPAALDTIPDLSGSIAEYAIRREAQYGGWVVMSAAREPSFALTCYFSGHAPVALSHCRAS